ncbi:MAG: ACT domain-containing protein [Myxococcota bacterium]
MTTTYNVRLKRAEGALVRMLGLVGRRGFEPVDLNAAATACGRWIDVHLTVQGERPSDLLARQIERLFDVEQVTFADAVAADGPAAPIARIGVSATG